jgi:hypothetical protein
MMWRLILRAAQALALSVFALSVPVSAKDKQVWDVTEAGKETILFYGIPESHAVTILFNCQAGKPVSIVTPITPRNPKKGKAERITLGNGTLTAVYDGKVGHDEEEGYHLEALSDVGIKILDVLRTGTTLTISVAGQQERVPLGGIARALAKFETRCFKT